MKKMIVAAFIVAMMLTACGENSVNTAIDDTKITSETVVATETTIPTETATAPSVENGDETESIEATDYVGRGGDNLENESSDDAGLAETIDSDNKDNESKDKKDDVVVTPEHEPESEPETEPVGPPKTGLDSEETEKPIETELVQHTHSYVSAVTTAATCTSDGVRTYTCSCGDNYVKSIEALGHNYSSGYCVSCGASDPDYVAPTAPETTEPPVTEPDSNAPYDGDTAVPPDVEGPSDNGSVQPCTSHDMVLTETKIDSSYQLYNYVTDHFTCSRCGYSETSVHIASANISDATITSAESSIVARVNQLRATHGLPELWTDGTWNAWAGMRASELSLSYGHIRPNGGSWLHSEGTYLSVAENIAAGQPSGTSFYDAFYSSPSHKNAMLSPDAVGIAVGIYVDENGHTYCAMVLIGNY